MSDRVTNRSGSDTEPAMWLGLRYNPAEFEEVLGVFSTRERAEEWCRYWEANHLPRGIRDYAVQRFRVDCGNPDDVEFLS